MQRLTVAGLDRGEMTAVERHHDLGTDPLGKGDHAGVRAAEWEVGVGLDELADAVEVLTGGALDVEGPEAAQEGCFGPRPEPASNKIGCLGDDLGGNDQPEIRSREDRVTSLVVVVVGVGRRVERAGVNDREHPEPTRP